MPGPLVAIASTVASSAIQAGISSLFGGGSDSTPHLTNKEFLAWTPGINSGALTATPYATNERGRGFDVALGADYQAGLNQFQSLSNNYATQLGRLRERVQPGFSELRRSRLEGLGNDRTRVLGDLRDQLARRRVLGSSFANDTLTRAELEYSQEGDRIRAESLLAELDVTANLISQESEARLLAVERGLGALEFVGNAALAIQSGVTASLTSSAQLQAELAAQNAAGTGNFLGSIAQPIGDAVGNWIGSMGSGGGKK